MWALLFLLVASATAQDPLICPAYACTPPGYELSGHTCIEPNTTSLFQMSLCPGFSGTYGCVENPDPEKPSMCQTLPPPIVDKSLPGQPCNSNKDCFGYVGSNSSETLCIINVCHGLSIKSTGTCSSDPECDVGLYCDLVQGEANGKCAFQLPLNSSCTRDEECSNELACTGYTQLPNIVEGICIPYYSLENGAAVHKCENNNGEGVSNLCKSATCRPNNLEIGGPGACISPYVSKAPQSCTFDSNCTGTSVSTSKLQPNYTITKSCQCGYSSSGTPYCPVFGGDNIAQSLLGFKMELIDSFASLNTTCHTSLRFSDFCFSLYLSSSDFLTFQRTKSATEAFFKFQENDYCVQGNILNDYYQLTEESISCRAYSCASTLSQSQCVAFDQGSNTYELSVCPSGDVCAVDDLGFGNVTCSAAQVANGTVYPGEPCTIGSQCIVEGCTNGRCDGIQSGDNCTDSSQCDIGLYCNPNDLKCEKLLNVGQQCLSESDCVMTAGCDLSKSQCTTYFTLPINATVYCPSSDFTPLCASAWCKSSPGSVYGMCASAPKSTGGLPSPCKTDDDCWDSTSTYQTTCTCGYNPTGQRYCGLFPGDSYYANLITDLNMVINEADTANAVSNTCQTTRRFTAACLNLTITQMNSENFTMLQNYYLAKQLPLLWNNDDCVKQMFTSEYWSIPPTNGNNTSSAVAVAVASALVWLSLAG